MKTQLRSLTCSLAVLSGLIASPLTAAPAAGPADNGAVMYPVGDVWLKGESAIKIGMYQGTVRNTFGRPTCTPYDNVWIYHRYTSNLDQANERDCHNLLVTFVDGRVKSVRLVNDAAVNMIVAEAKKNPDAIAASLFTTK